MREIFGSTSNITAMRKIVVVEGRAAEADARRPSDVRIYGFLSDQFGQLTMIAGGGKGECAALARNLNSSLHALSPNLRAVALVDRDTEIANGKTSDVLFLPVSMIENLLIDPDVIWKVIAIVQHKITFTSRNDVAAALDAILDEMEDHEISRRIKASVEPKTFRLKDPVDEARHQVEEFTAALLEMLSEERLAALKSRAKAAVHELKKNGRRREMFDGKRVLDEFFKRYLHNTGMSKEIFVYTCAREASNRQSVSRFMTELFLMLGIAPTLEAAGF